MKWLRIQFRKLDASELIEACASFKLKEPNVY